MHANAELIQGAYDAFGRGDIPGVIHALDDNVEWSSPRTLPQGGDFHGKAGVGKFFETIGGAWANLALQVESVSEAGAELVIGVVRADGTLRNGSSAGYGAAHLFTVRNGKIVRFRELTDLDTSMS